MGNSRFIIYYFLEDIAHENFVKSLIKRVAAEESIQEENLQFKPLSVRGGSKVISRFKQFIKDYSKFQEIPFDLLIVTIDGNCKGYNERRKELEKCIKPDCLFKDRIVLAVPNPHIERWFILDQRAFKKGVGIEKAPPLPSYKCDKNYYKRLLIQTLKEAGINSLIGGAEYAERIVENIEDINTIDQDTHDHAGFKNFIQELRWMLKKL